MKKYKIRLECNSFVDVVVKAKNKEEAISEARRVGGPCKDYGFRFGEFLPVEEGDELEN